jgi:hypothetical protein
MTIGKTGPVWGDTNGRVEDIRKECRRMNMVEIIGTHMYGNGAMRPFETVLRKGEARYKGQ